RTRLLGIAQPLRRDVRGRELQGSECLLVSLHHLPERRMVPVLLDERGDGVEETAQRTPGMGGHLTPHKIERLDAVGALVDQRDGAVAYQLLHPMIADVAVTAID